MKTNKTVLATQKAPQAVGPYSQGIQLGNLVLLSGQIPLDPATGALVPGGIKEQTDRVLKNIGAVLNSAQVGFREVIKTTVYMQDLASFADMNEVYSRYFPAPSPARSTVQVAALPKGALIEIEAIAAKPDTADDVLV